MADFEMAKIDIILGFDNVLVIFPIRTYPKIFVRKINEKKIVGSADVPGEPSRFSLSRAGGERNLLSRACSSSSATG